MTASSPDNPVEHLIQVLRETDPDKGREIDEAFARFDPAVLDQDEPIQGSPLDLYERLPRWLIIEPRHREVGKATYQRIREANGRDDGTRDFAYDSTDLDLHARAEMGYAVEAAFRESLGFGCTCAGVNLLGRVEHNADADLLGWPIDVKWTGTNYFFVRRKQAEDHPRWYFVQFQGHFLADSVTLHGAAFGADFLREGFPVQFARASNENVGLPVGYAGVVAPE